MLEKLDGSTRVYVVVGDPIAQVKSPSGLTREFAARGVNAVCVPIHVTTLDLDALVQGLTLARNIDGIAVTVPHKFAMFKHCTKVTERARVLGAVNVLRRDAEGGWFGDVLDGQGFLGGVRDAGFDSAGKRALVVGAGGAGSSIALALIDAGVRELAIHDMSHDRRDVLIARLKGARNDLAITIGSEDPGGFDLAVNATTAGMRPGDPLPMQAERLHPRTFVADVITVPEVTPLIERARSIGCPTQTGVGMFKALAKLGPDFLLAGCRLGVR